jgi:hypothetical protein
MLFKEQIKPQFVRDKPLCMDQYRVIFATERIPQQQMDVCKTVRPNDTVVVLVQNLFYLLELTHNGYANANSIDGKECCRLFNLVTLFVFIPILCFYTPPGMTISYLYFLAFFVY